MLNSQIELLKFENDTKITYLKNSLKKKRVKVKLKN